jgi:hypothetical protein
MSEEPEEPWKDFASVLISKLHDTTALSYQYTLLQQTIRLLQDAQRGLGSTGPSSRQWPDVSTCLSMQMPR